MIRKEWAKLQGLMAECRRAETHDFPTNAPKLGHAIARSFLRTPSYRFPRHILQVGGSGEYLTELNYSLPNATCHLINGSNPAPFVRELGPRDIIPREHFDLILLPANHLLRHFDPRELSVLLDSLRVKGKMVMPILFEGDDRFCVGSEIFFVMDEDAKESTFWHYTLSPLPQLPEAKVRTFSLCGVDVEFPGTVAAGQLMIFSK